MGRGGSWWVVARFIKAQSSNTYNFPGVPMPRTHRHFPGRYPSRTDISLIGLDGCFRGFKGILPKKIFFFFCFYNVILLEKLCKKVLYSMAKLFFNQKLFHFFCQNVPSSIHSISIIRTVTINYYPPPQSFTIVCVIIK